MDAWTKMDGGKVQPEVLPVSTLLSAALLQDPKFLAAAATVLLTVVFLLFVRGSSSSRRAKGPKGVPRVVLVGPPMAGKTSLFAELALDERPATIPSIHSSTTTFTLPSGKAVTLTDTPGHARLRDEVKAELRGASGALFVVDAGVVGRPEAVGKVAELLPHILAFLAAQSLRTSQPSRLLLLTHKSDLSPGRAPSALTQRTRSALTAELDRLKLSRATVGGKIEGITAVPSSGSRGVLASLKSMLGLGRAVPHVQEDVGEEEAEELVWGEKGAFRWEDIEGVEVEWAVSGGLGPEKVQAGAAEKQSEAAEDQLDEIRDWLDSL